MGSHARQVVFHIAVFSIGTGVGVAGYSVVLGRFDRDTGYLTGFGIILGGLIVLALIPIYRIGAENGRKGAENGRRITALERALRHHKAHDRKALEAAVRYACVETGTGPQPLHRIARR